MLKSKEDSLSILSTRLTAIRVLATMYEKLGRMTGRSFEETIGLLNKGLRNAESSTRAETMFAFGKNIQEYLLLGQLFKWNRFYIQGVTTQSVQVWTKVLSTKKFQGFNFMFDLLLTMIGSFIENNNCLWILNKSK